MGMYTVDCTKCKTPFAWFSGNYDQVCGNCLQKQGIVYYSANGPFPVNKEIDKGNQDIDNKIKLMKEYLFAKYKEEDWHGVMDAAADIRELVAKKSVLK